MSGTTADEIKEKVNIVDEIGKVVKLRRAGTNYKGLCPFHSEKTPSFVVSENKQIFTCFGCNTTGDVISFVQRYYNLEFQEACQKICAEHGIEYKAGNRPDSKKNDEFYEINRLAAKFFFDQISSGENPGLKYLAGRGISVDTIKKFGIGYAPDSWDSLLKYMKDKGMDEEKLVSLGLLAKKKNGYYDKFRDRVMFPIINVRGKVIGFGGRALNDEVTPKYLNSPESPIFHKKNNLYGINLARKEMISEDRIILVEGYMDVVALSQAGITNVCASLGTALTPDQCRLISKYTKNVVLSYDSDTAGRNAALRGTALLREQGLSSRVVHVTDGKDPDEFIKKKGRSAYLELADRGVPDILYIADDIRKKHDLDNTMGRVAFIKDIVPVLNKLSPAEQELYSQRIAEESNISEAAIKRELDGTIIEEEVPVKRERDEADNRDLKISTAEKELIKLAVTEEQYVDDIVRNRDLFYSPAAVEIVDEIDNNRDNDEPLERLVDEELAGVIAEIRSEIRIDPYKTLDDCLRSLKRHSLQARYREIIQIIDMTDDKDEIDALLKEQMEIQKQLTITKRR